MKRFLTILFLLLAPSLAFAQVDLLDVGSAILDLLDLAIPILITLSVVYFFWGVSKFILAAGDSEGRRQGTSIMVWGIIGLFVIVSVWGLVAVLQNTFYVTGPGTRTVIIDPFGVFP